MLRAAVDAIAASGTRYQILAFEYCLNLFYRLKLLFVKRLKVPHKSDIVLNLFHVAHAGKNHNYARKTCSKAQSIARITSTIQLVKNSLRLLRQINKIAAFDRL